MAKESRSQQKTVGRVMHEFKHGELESSTGRPVKNRRQAVAIALSEAGASNQQSPKQNRRQLSRTKGKERSGRTAQAETEGRGRGGGPTRAELLTEARRKGVSGTSYMRKAELQQAIRRT